jgi:hypothetical protein
VDGEHAVKEVLVARPDVLATVAGSRLRARWLCSFAGGLLAEAMSAAEPLFI